MINFKEIEPRVLGASQKGQDSFIEAVLNEIGEGNRYFIEFGAVDGFSSSNTVHLRNEGWVGLLLENGQSNPAINLHSEFITAENICDLFRKYKVPESPDFISIDVDGQDFHILNSILKEYLPRFIMVEACVRFAPDESVIQKYDPNFVWKGKTWVGSSPLAFQRMVSKFGYSVIGQYLDDLFIVKNDLLKNSVEFTPEQNISLYESHGPCEFDPNGWESYE